MFSTDPFIKASRQFVCIRIETFENKESEALVKRVLHGKFANTSFVILDPQGTKRLTRSGRSPGMAMIRGRSRTDVEGGQNASIIAQMNQIARQFRARGDRKSARLQDFHSLRQALNCASADQRLLVYVNAPGASRAAFEKKLRVVLSDKDIIGKFHVDFHDPKVDRNWGRMIHGAKNTPGVLIVRSSQFGLDGQALAQLSLSAKTEAIKEAMLTANGKFAKVEKRKDYERHVQAGRRQGIFFKNEIGRQGTEEAQRGKGIGGRPGRGNRPRRPGLRPGIRRPGR